MRTKHLFWATTAAAIFGFFLFSARAEPGARDAMRAGAKLIDVRTTTEFAAEHLAGAVNIPVDELPRRLAEVGEKSAPVVVYCRSGKRSARAKKILQDAGFKQVHDLGAMSNGE